MTDETLVRRAAQGDAEAAATLLGALHVADPHRQLAAMQAVDAALAGGLAAQLLRFAATCTWGGAALPDVPPGSAAQHDLCRAAEAILISDPQASEPALVEALAAGDPAIRRTAARLLSDLPAAEETRQALRRLVLDANAHVAAEAARALARLHDVDAIPELVAALGQAHPDARGPITDALIALGPAVIDPLQPAIPDPREHVRWHAARVLAALRDERAAPALAQMLNDMSPGVRWLAEVGLRRLPPRVAARAVLRELLQDEATDWLRISAGGVLAHLDGPVRRIVEPVRQALRSSLAREEAPLRAADALHALQALPAPQQTDDTSEA